jgi:hypothetical protein
MTAEIIQFAKPQSIPAKFKPAGHKSVLRRPEPELEKEVVRCAVYGRLYEIEFRGESICRVYFVHHRHRGRDGHIETVRRREWSAGAYGRGELNPEFVEAAWRARGQSGANTSREASIAYLRERHAQLMRQAEKVEATIVVLQRGIN